jgi:hypothetical protein
LNDPGPEDVDIAAHGSARMFRRDGHVDGGFGVRPGSVTHPMGSLIKKRRKRMRKKKHKKMLRRTRHQRRK